MKIVGSISYVAEAFVDFVYPPACATCSGKLHREESYICARCWDNFERVVATESVIQVIEEKFLADEAIDRMDSVFVFGADERVRTAVHLLKYNGVEDIADRFGVCIAAKIAGDELLSVCDVVAPVPLHPARMRERGYNQSELISRKIGEVLRILHVPGLLRRTRYTRTQTLFDAEGRMKNIAGAFSVGEQGRNNIEGKKILLVDDVITTGSTIRECARALKGVGASEVYAASAAIAI